MAKAAKKPATPKTVEELVQHALKLIVQNPEAKWLGKAPSALFNEKDENHALAMTKCENGDPPLLKRVGTKGAITPAGFARVSSDLNPEELVPLVKTLAHTMAAKERADFLEGVISRNPATSPELLPLFEAAVETAKHEEDKRLAEVAKQRARDVEIKKSLERFLELQEQRRQDRVNALRREWELLGENASDLPPHKPAVVVPPVVAPPVNPPAPLVARTAEEKDFCRDVVDRLAAAWRDAWDKDLSSCEFLETAMWNISGMRMIGEKDAKVAFDGRYHESRTPLFTNDAAKIERPGWLLKLDAAEYVALKAAVTKA